MRQYSKIIPEFYLPTLLSFFIFLHLKYEEEEYAICMLVNKTVLLVLE